MERGRQLLVKLSMILWLTFTCSCDVVATEVKVAVFLFRSESIYGDTRILPAFKIARETISHRVEIGEYVNFTLHWLYSSEGCGHGVQYAVREAAQLHFKEDVVAYFGPSCSASMQSVADFAAPMNIPVFSGSAGATELENKVRYPTLTQTVNKPSTMVSFIRELFYMYGWDSCVLFIHGHFFTRPGKAIEDGLREANIRPYSIYLQHLGDKDVDSALEEASMNSQSKYGSNY